MILVSKNEYVLMGGGKNMIEASWVIDDGPATALACSNEGCPPSMVTQSEG